MLLAGQTHEKFQAGSILIIAIKVLVRPSAHFTFCFDARFFFFRVIFLRNYSFLELKMHKSGVFEQ
ncbi:hypothetical protein EZS27_002303 [termite gut metagenome]|uniref:Uncharacterized protein n=1 Tax=termite gut metagenome TaxID=433724 RepID=A0A5J4SWG5_9ZZZZ